MQLISIRIQELLRLIFVGKYKNHARLFEGHFLAKLLRITRRRSELCNSYKKQKRNGVWVKECSAVKTKEN